jgi:hypothetical protein
MRLSPNADYGLCYRNEPATVNRRKKDSDAQHEARKKAAEDRVNEEQQERYRQYADKLPVHAQHTGATSCTTCCSAFIPEHEAESAIAEAEAAGDLEKPGMLHISVALLRTL